ncbi:MAG: hypothetical protein KDK39_10065 [Leptospiraceae bacterium]|nr:hypothetical protein [Leptospiraceae bacterium]
MENLKQKILANTDFIAATLLGLGTIFAAFAAYQSSLWGGNCLTAYNEAVIKFGDANREYLNGSMEVNFDTMVYLESLRENPRTTDDVEKMMTRDLVRAISWADSNYDKKTAALGKQEEAALEAQIDQKWEDFEEAEGKDDVQEKLLNEIEVLDQKISYYPFNTSPGYISNKRARGDALAKEAQAKMKEGLTANGIGDAFTLVTVYFTIALFFAGLASVLKNEQIKLAFVLFSTVVILFSLVRALFLPFA